MPLPTGAWGTEFAAIPFALEPSSSYQVVTNTYNTTLSIGNNRIEHLNPGEYYQFDSGANIITASNPIHIIQQGRVSDDRSQEKLTGRVLMLT
jgi:hypothetical protein